MATSTDLTSLILNSGSKTTKTTTKSTASSSAVDEYIRQILNGTSGVASITGAERGAGLYGSSTASKQLSELYSTAAAKAALLGAGTETTTKTQGTSIADQLTAIGINAAVKPILSAGADLVQQGLVKAGLMDAPTLAGTTTASTLAADTAAAGVNGTGAVGVTAGGTYGSEGAAAAGGSAGLASALGGYALPGIGGAVSGVLTGQDNRKGYATSALSGAATGALAGLSAGGIGAIPGAAVGGITGLVGNLIGSKSIICTALMNKGLLDAKLYSLGQEYLNTLDEDTIAGYHSWACAIADKIDNGSLFWIMVTCPFARSRTALLADGKAWKHPLGWLTKVIGEPICKMIGKTLPLEV